MKQYTVQFAKQFKKAYSYKMGGTQTVILPNGQRFYFDDRQYYSGRGSKYNSGIKHDNIGDIVVSRKELSQALKLEREIKALNKARQSEERARLLRYADHDADGIYPIKVEQWGTFIELSDAEINGKYFNAEKLANTLGISVADAELLKSEGKTYVFAEKLDGSGVIELFHPSLSCNYLTITIGMATAERIADFKKNRSSWEDAPFAEMLGQTSAKNHFVC